MTILAVLVTMFLSQAAALAGGGGCDGECPPAPPNRPQVACRLIHIDQLD